MQQHGLRPEQGGHVGVDVCRPQRAGRRADPVRVGLLLAPTASDREDEIRLTSSTAGWSRRSNRRESRSRSIQEARAPGSRRSHESDRFVLHRASGRVLEICDAGERASTFVDRPGVAPKNHLLATSGGRVCEDAAPDRRVRVSPGQGVRDGVSRCAADYQRTGSGRLVWITPRPGSAPRECPADC